MIRKEVVHINSAFHKLEETKKQRIIDAAIEEFVEKGFEQASTNAIVKKAQIGKGMLFHYFNSKKDLFLYLFDYCSEIMKREYLYSIDIEEGDIIKRFRQASLLKQEILMKRPYLFDFMSMALITNTDHLMEELNDRRQKLEKYGYGRLYKNIDTTMFRDEMDVEKALQLLTWAMDGYRSAKERELKGKQLRREEYDVLFQEFDDYLKVLKQAFYK
ncbi:TetR/AcrR family transcriptional regulator [Alteribacter populi]|uniref:TetR/AcrR family transcriptional regulator n=1 Tax=Alteribacter populi TaxID=2011011 RepID=UPI000BBB1A6F|nr:TetR/AcrR family transcriptional regulator [Alteribacter populi]